MFDGEKASLEAILQTNTIKAPKPVKVIDLSPGGGAVFVMEHLDMRSINRYYLLSKILFQFNYVYRLMVTLASPRLVKKQP